MTGFSFPENSSKIFIDSLNSIRKNAVKYILDALRCVNDLDSLYEILSCTQKLADDIGWTRKEFLLLESIVFFFFAVTQVQIDTLEKFVPIIEYLIGNVENGDILIKDYLFQSIVQTVGHGNNRIRKASQSALIRLFELELIQIEQIENDIIPALCQLERASDDFKNESILVCLPLSLLDFPRQRSSVKDMGSEMFIEE